MNALTVGLGGEADILLEVLTEKRLGGEVELGGYLLDAQIGGFEQLTRFGDNHLHNPLLRRGARLLLDDGSEVTGSNLLFSIESHLALHAVVAEEGDHEVMKDQVLLPLRQRMERTVGIIEVDDLVKHGLGHRLEDVLHQDALLHGEYLHVGLLDALLQRFSQGEQMAKLWLCQGGTRGMTQVQQILHTERSRSQRQHKREVNLYHNALRICTAMQQTDDGGRDVDVHIPTPQPIGLLTEKDFHLASRAEKHTAAPNRGKKPSFVPLLHRTRLHGEKAKRQHFVHHFMVSARGHQPCKCTN